MDARLIAVIMKLSEDMAIMEKALAQTQELLKEVLKDDKDEDNGKKHHRRRPRYLAQQQPRWSGTRPWRVAPRENDEEQ